MQVNDIFYSLKGEGLFTGKPMIFVRLAGCNVHCSFCDTEYQHGLELSVEEILTSVTALNPTQRIKSVVITGGEPLMQDIADLVSILQREDYHCHLETNGTLPVPDHVDWVACSPKGPADQLCLSTVSYADEVKFLVGTPGWVQYIDDVMARCEPTGQLYVMPIAKALPPNAVSNVARQQDELLPSNLQAAMQFITRRPEFSLCIQAHKYLNIK